MRKTIAVAGVATPRALGDALQCYVTVKLIQKRFHGTKVMFFCPDLKDGLFVFKDLDLNASLLYSSIDRSYILRNFQRRVLSKIFPSNSTIEGEKRTTVKIQTKKADAFSNLKHYIKEEIFVSYDKYANSGTHLSTMKPFSFDASIFGGHTICASIFPFVHKYEAFRSATRGPMVTSPISISKLALQHYAKKKPTMNKIMLKRLVRSLQKFDFIYTRGPYSLKILRDYLNINERKLAMALDSGFGAKLICPHIERSNPTEKTFKILIIPRKSYFYFYEREGLYKLYLNSLAELISWLSRSFDVEIYLTSETIDVKYSFLGGQGAINDLLATLKKRRDKKHFKNLTCVVPESLVSACRLASTMNLVISSRMHGGIMALGSGVPAFFILPSVDTKMLDVLSYVGLDVNSVFINMFDANMLKTENFVSKIGKLVENINPYRDKLEHNVNRALQTIEFPVEKLNELSE